MLKFIADESVDFRIVKSLLSSGYKVEAIINLMPGAKDIDVLSLANKSNSILITEDKDFGELTFRLKRQNKGILLLRLSGIGMNIKTEKILSVIKNHGKELENKFTVVTSENIRFRKI